MYLGSAELAAVCAILGKIPNKEEYLEIINKKLKNNDIYSYLNFNLIDNFTL